MNDMLPNKPSDLLQVALDDLRLCEKDPLYAIEMGDWHKANGKCRVCLAGAVMAKTLRCSPTSSFVPSMIGSGYATHLTDLSGEQRLQLTKQLSAIDRFRSGYIGPAFSFLNMVLPKAIPFSMDMHAYSASRSGFYDDMNKLIVLLKQHGC